MKRPPICVVCADDKRLKDYDEQLKAAKEEF